MNTEFAALKDEIKDGVIPATVVPLTPDIEVAEDDLLTHAGTLASVEGVPALIANAHSGESTMTPTEEKVEIVRLHREAAGGDARVFSGVHGESTPQAAAEARRLVEAGAEALMPVPIGVQSHGDPRILRDHYRGIADAVDVPLIAFQFGNYGAINQPVSAWVQLVEMEEVIALKDATFDPVRYEKTVRALSHIEDYTLLSGNDTFLYHSYHLGAESALISYANLVPEMHVEKVRAVNRDDLERGRELRAAMRELTDFLYADPPGRYRNRIKAALELQGVFEHDTVRPPAQSLGPEAKDELAGILRRMGEL
ncbi:MAG: dihydrodipicolinate synthase family protein [Halobacteriales archaeon]